MNPIKIIKICLIFLLGVLSANLAGIYFYGLENPFSTEIFGSNENQAPSDFIKESQIEVYDDKVVINIEGASLGRYAATGSMKPFLDENSNGIRIKPESEEDIQIGDVITFKRDNYFIVHRVIKKGVDGYGVYFITQGDNNSITDGKVRFEDIEYKIAGILY